MQVSIRYFIWLSTKGASLVHIANTEAFLSIDFSPIFASILDGIDFELKAKGYHTHNRHYKKKERMKTTTKKEEKKKIAFTIQVGQQAKQEPTDNNSLENGWLYQKQRFILMSFSCVKSTMKKTIEIKQNGPELNNTQENRKKHEREEKEEEAAAKKRPRHRSRNILNFSDHRATNFNFFDFAI